MDKEKMQSHERRKWMEGWKKKDERNNFSHKNEGNKSLKPYKTKISPDETIHHQLSQ